MANVIATVAQDSSNVWWIADVTYSDGAPVRRTIYEGGSLATHGAAAAEAEERAEREAGKDGTIVRVGYTRKDVDAWRAEMARIQAQVTGGK